MIETDGVVTAVEGGKAWVEAGRRSACGHCDASGSCGGSLFSELFGNRPVRIEVDNTLKVKIGDRVILGLPERVMLSGSIRLYLLPLIGLFFGAVAGEFYASRLSAEFTEPWAILGGLFGLTAVLLFLHRISSTEETREKARAVIVRKVSAGVAVGLPSGVSNPESPSLDVPGLRCKAHEKE